MIIKIFVPMSPCLSCSCQVITPQLERMGFLKLCAVTRSRTRDAT